MKVLSSLLFAFVISHHFFAAVVVNAQPSPCTKTWNQYNFTYQVSQFVTSYSFGTEVGEGYAANGCLISGPEYTTKTGTIYPGAWITIAQGSYIDVNDNYIINQQALYIDPAGENLYELFCACSSSEPFGVDCCAEEIPKGSELSNVKVTLEAFPKSNEITFDDTFCYQTENAGDDTCLCLGTVSTVSAKVPCPSASPSTSLSPGTAASPSPSPRGAGHRLSSWIDVLGMVYY